MTKASFRTISSRNIYSGKVVALTVDRVIEPGGIEVKREVVHHSGSVAVLPLLDDGRLILVRQFRYAAQQSLWELAAGGMKPGESPIEAARRELLEEAGYRATALEELVEFFPSPGVLTERMHVIEASGLTRSGSRPEADEHIRTGRFTLPELEKMLRTGRLRDAKTIVGILWLLHCKRSRRRHPDWGC